MLGGGAPTGEESEWLAALWISLMALCCTSYKQDHSRKVFIDYAAVIIGDTACDHLVYFIDFAGP